MKPHKFSVLAIVLLFSVAFVFLGGCTEKTGDASGADNLQASADKTAQAQPNVHQTAGKGVTAKQAWKKVKPFADKWSSNYRIASISDVDDVNTRRIDGLSLGWEFYLEICDEYYSGSMSYLCSKGRTRSFYYYSGKYSGKVGAVSDKEDTLMPSGRETFDPSDFVIDSDRAQELARERSGQAKNGGEEFVMDAYAENGIPYWRVKRQCWIKGDGCDIDDDYTYFVNIKTGEIYDKKPKRSEY
ncbi:MAG: hypothetical protein GXO64_04600 [Candidatus Micrarchaeota archaeon]|nr:hypothetical protein [Candidatus Micrarchaeota archaeon]